ncbi:MAG: hypothetical protein WA510_06810 [Acidobacteriaceae bacterium]
MTQETIAAAAPAVEPTPAPAPGPGPTPNAASPSFASGTVPTSSVDPGKFPGREEYAAALLAEKLSALEPAQAAAPAENEPETVSNSTEELPAEPSAAAEAPDAPETEVFELEAEIIVTPELLSQMITDNPEFGKLLQTDTKLKGQLYKTAREAAELKPYRDIFPDLDSARAALDHSSTWLDVRQTFLGSTTREGTMASLGKIAELSYERDPDGNVVMQDGKPVIGDDFFGFVDNVVLLDLEYRAQDISQHLQANNYRSEEERGRDQRTYDALQALREESAAASPALEAHPDALRRKANELDQRERALNLRQHSERVEERRSFETGLQEEAQTRIQDGISRIIANVEKQGGVVSPYLKNILPKAIGAKLIRKIQVNPALQDQMHSLQRLPIGDASRQRRLAAIDRAVQQYLPDVAREELREAGVQIANASAARRTKVDAQIDNTRKTEPKGSTGPAGTGSAGMSSSTAFDQAQAEWQRTHPGKPFDKLAREQILPRVLQLMTSR